MTQQEITYKTLIDQLLDISISQHGYWLVNHIKIIKEDLTKLLKQHGLIITASILNEIDNPLVVALYEKIEANKKQTNRWCN